MKKIIGFSRNLKIHWLNKIVELVSEFTDQDVIKRKLNEYLSYEIKSETNLRKTREILLNIWSYKNDIIENKQEVLDLMKKHPECSIAINYAMILCTYPVFYDICSIIGRNSDFKEEITLNQLKSKLYDEWGERTTIYHSTDKIIATLKELNIISAKKPGQYLINKAQISNQEVINFLIMVSLKLGGSQNYFSLKNISELPILFPFEFKICEKTISEDKKFTLNTFGNNVSLTLK